MDVFLCQFLNPAHFAIRQHHLDPMRVGWTICQNACNQTFGQFSGWLVLLQHDPHMAAWLNILAAWDSIFKHVHNVTF